MPDDILLLAPLVRRMRERIRAMEQSRFWMLRNRFFALKNGLRFSTDGAWPAFEIPAAVEGAVDGADPYAQWLRLNAPRPADLARMREMVDVLPWKPRFSLLFVFGEDGSDGAAELLTASLESLHEQVYGYWEACIVLPRAVPRSLLECVSADSRIVVAEAGDGPPLDAAFSAATGDYVGLIYSGDRLAEEALVEIALLLNRHAEADMLYADEDTIDFTGARRDPYFKPDWSPELLLSRMYFGNVFYRRSLLAEVMTARDEAPGDRADLSPLLRDPTYDIALRATELSERIDHIPRILFHRRAPKIGTSLTRAAVAPDGNAAFGEAAADDAAAGAGDAESDIATLKAALERRGDRGRVLASSKCAGTYLVRYEIVHPGRISIIVPTRDHGPDVDRCLTSIFSHAGNADFEILLVDNGSTQTDSLATFAAWSLREPRVRIVRDEAPFNFSAINNRAVALTSGTYVLFLNNDTEVRSDDWLRSLVEYAQRPSIAAVGAKLLFPDGSVQHAGVALGIGGVAGHSHRLAEPDASGYFCALESVTNYSAVTAACLMVRRTIFDEAGGFDETLSVAYNDVDLCLKFCSRGYRNVYLPHVVLTHAESKTRGHDVGFRKSVRAARERLLMEERWGPLLANDPYYNPNLTRRSEDYAIRVDELI